MSEIGRGIPDAGWDHMIASLQGNVLQSRSWAQLQERLGRSACYGQGEGWAWLGHLRTGRGLRYLYVPYGPAANSVSSMETALASVKQAGQAMDADFIRFEPAGPLTAAMLRDIGARATAEVQPQRTLILDLTIPEPALRLAVSQSNRNLIHSAARRGIRCRVEDWPGNRAMEQFLAMLHDTVAHNDFRAHADSYYRQILEVLGAVGIAKLYMAYASTQPVAGAIAFDFAGVRYYVHAGAFQDLNRRHKAAVPLLWTMIQDAQNHGLHTFDFWGIAPTDDPSHPRAGLTRFKRSFGGHVKEYAGTWDLPVKRAKYQLYRLAKRVLKAA